MFKHLSVAASPKKLNLKVSYVMETDNYAENLLQMLKAGKLKKPLEIRHC
jgi:hypothetical protein